MKAQKEEEEELKRLIRITREEKMEQGKIFYLKRTIDVFTQNVIEEVKEQESSDGEFDIQFDKDTYKYFQQE